MKLDDITQWIEFAVLLSTAFAAYKMPRVLRWVTKKMKGLFASLRAIGDLAELMPHLNKLAGMEATLGTIRSQVLPNGGSSLNDKVAKALATTERTERAVGLLSATMRAHHDSDPGTAKFEADENGDFTWASRTLLRWCNCSIEQVLGMGWSNNVAEHDRDRVRDEWESAIEERREFHMRFSMRNHDGQEFLVEAGASPIYSDNKVEHWVGVFSRVALPV